MSVLKTILLSRSVRALATVATVAVVATGCTYPWQRAVTDTNQAAQQPSPAATVTTNTNDATMKKDVVVTLAAQNGSGQAGTATISDVNGKAKVTIAIAPSTDNVQQPAHIHVGACPTPGAVKYPLTPVGNGASETMLDISVDELMAQLPLAINIHKSTAEISTYVACGDITTNNSDIKDPAMNGAVKTFNVGASNFSFSLNEIRVKKGDTVKIVLSNNDGMHDWVIDEFNARTSRIGEGQTETIEFKADKIGTFEYYCSVGQHRAMGMKGNLIVE